MYAGQSNSQRAAPRGSGSGNQQVGKATIRGLTNRPELNGQTCEVLRTVIGGRKLVHLNDGTQIKLLIDNLEASWIQRSSQRPVGDPAQSHRRRSVGNDKIRTRTGDEPSQGHTRKSSDVQITLHGLLPPSKVHSASVSTILIYRYRQTAMCEPL